MEENVTPIVNTPPPVIPVKNSDNSFLITLLSVLLLISVFIAGFFAYQTQNLVKELTKLQPTPTPIATASPDPTADWKTYTNIAGFSIKYPGSGSVNFLSIPSISVYAGDDINPNATKMSISQTSPDGPIEELIFNFEIKQKSLDYDLKTNTEFKIDGHVAKKQNLENSDVDKYILKLDKNIFLYISVSNITTKKDLANEILSTFKFISFSISNEGESCGNLAGPAGNAQCATGLICKHKNPNDFSDIGICVK